MVNLREQTDLSAEELETWVGLATLLEWLPPALDAQLQRSAGLTHFEYGVLYALADAPDHALRMGVLAGYANSTLSRLSRAVARMETRGWVRRAADPGDGRYVLATATPDGLAVVERASPGHVDLVRTLVLGQLTRAQTEQLGRICRRVTAAVRDHGA